MKTFRVCVFLLLVQFASATAATARLRLDSTSLSALRAHSGQRVVLIGYFRYSVKTSVLLPAEQKPEDLDYDRAVWVEFADGEEWKFLGLPFQGSLKIDGILEAEPGKPYGHIGWLDAELRDARIEGIIPRDLWSIIVISVVICLVIIVIKWRRKIRRPCA